VERCNPRSGILERYPQINCSTDKVGIFGKICKLNASLRNDKIVLKSIRKLIADPKESRRQKAGDGTPKALQDGSKSTSLCV
ncbi:MAG: RnfH family protein, partial [Gammaproteobacteria bacterium]|nr:RnfH family protein [Gammaproteobacteria bacterium]